MQATGLAGGLDLENFTKGVYLHEKHDEKVSLVIICVMMIFTVSAVPSFAADDQNYENAIIGRAEVSDVPKTRANLLQNRLLIDFDATAIS